MTVSPQPRRLLASSTSGVLVVLLLAALSSLLPDGADALSGLARTTGSPSPVVAADTPASASSSSSSSSIRPLQHNWWPVSLVSTLKSDRPNGVELLGRKFVLWKSQPDDDDDESGGWSCLDDACAHRFAPLSEGRVLETTETTEGSGGDDDGDGAEVTASASERRLQCAYHGWEFDDSGSCGRVPQAGSGVTEGSCDVPSYPVRQSGGMVWVWADSSPSTFPLAESLPLPVSPLVERMMDVPALARIGFQRDLPYGAELLGENLLDLSHLPFSHHGVGKLNREGDKEMPMRMLSVYEKREKAQWEVDYRRDDGGSSNGDAAAGISLPMFQAEVVDAANADPTFAGMKAAGAPVGDDATCTISFHEPCHVRYRRQSGGGDDVPATHVELFLCPTSAGRSRVFLFNVMESMLPPVESANGAAKRSDFPNSTLRPPAPKASLKERVKKRVKGLFQRSPPYNQGVVFSHIFAHRIFDGDGIFLHKQGDRMERAALTYRDYSTPTSSDVLVNAYRRYLDVAARTSVDAGGLDGMAAAHAATGGAWSVAAEDGGRTSADTDFADVVQTAEGGSRRISPGAYDDALGQRRRREMLLDRYESHTASCEECSKALQYFERTSGRMDALRTALLGASGACAAAAVGGVGMAAAGMGVPLVAAGAAAAGTGATALGARMVGKAKGKLDRMAETMFKFEDYVHAEKN